MNPNPPPATCLNVNLSESRDQRRHTAPYIYPMSISPASSSSHRSYRNTASTTKLVRDYELWSLFNFVFLNCCCLGFLALMYSIKSRDHKIAGDIEKAHHFGRKAKSVNAAALIMSTFFIIFTIIVLCTMVATRTKLTNQTLGQLFPPTIKELPRTMESSSHN